MLETIEQETLNVVTTVVALLPHLLGALVLLLIGWLLARFLRMVTTRLTRSLNNLVASRFQQTSFDILRIPPSLQHLLSQVVFWATILVFATVAIRLIGFTGLAVWLDRVVVYLPSLLAGGLIIITGVIVGSVVRKLVTYGAAAADFEQSHLLGQISQVAFIIVGLVIGLGQLGVDVTFLIILIGIVLGAVLTGFSLAFGLGAKSLVENLIASQHIKLLIKPGQLVECGVLRGRVLEFTATGVVLETAEGRTIMPAKLCMDQSLSVVVPGQEGQDNQEVSDEHH